MNFTKKIYLPLLAIILASTLSFSQDKRTLETKVADILTEMPTENLGHLNRLLTEMVSLGDDGMELFIKGLKPVGSIDDDTRYRIALESLSRKLSTNPESSEARWYVQAIKSQYNEISDPEIKSFLLRRLKALALEEDLEFLAELANDSDQYKVALAVIVSSGSQSADNVIYDLYENSDGEMKGDYLKSLNDLGSKLALNDVISSISNSSDELKHIQLQYLANIADPSAFAVLKNEAARANYMPDKLNEVKYYLEFAENSDNATAQKVAQDIFSNSQKEDQMSYRARAITLIANNMKESKANKLLVKEFKASPSKKYRVALLNIVETFEDPSVYSKWEKLLKKGTPDQKAEILHMLNDKNVENAIDYIPKDFNHEMVALEAFLLRAKIQGKDAIPYILRGMENNDFANAGYTALKTVVEVDELAQIGHGIAELPPLSKIRMIELIAERNGKSQFEVIEVHLSDLNAKVREASHKALQFVSSEDDLPELTKLFSLAEPHNSEYVANALIASLNDIEDREKRENKYIELLEKTDKKDVLIKFAPEIGGRNIMELIVKTFNNGPNKKEAFEAIMNWGDPMIGPHLFNILKTTFEGSEVRKNTFEGYLKLCNSTDIPADQRVLMLYELMPYAENNDQKTKVINAFRTTRTYPAFAYVSQYLDNKDFQQAAAIAVMRIALPTPSEQEGLSGPEVASALEKCIEVMKGPESQYAKEDIKVYLSNMNKTNGYVSMFNGKDLTGWKGFVANPIALSKMTEKERKKKQEEANEELKKYWSVDGESIVFDGKGHNLVSVKEYGDFEMYVDWKITKGGDSGIYLRGTPQVQIWDTSRVEVGAQVGSGGLYNNQKNPSKPSKVADNLIGEWNTFYIKMIGEKVTVRLNGELVVDEVTLENYWDRSQPIFPSGPIELQAHGSDLEFRNIYIKELSSPDFSVTPEEKAAGFTSLLNGKNLDGWVGNKTDYYVEGGNILLNPENGGKGNLYTEKEYTNFIFRFEFQLTPGANNGLGIHTARTGDAAYSGKELQILDNTASIYANLKEYQYHGSIYGVVPAKRGHLKPVGEWNKQEVVVDGDKIKVTLNGTVILDADYVEASKNGTIDGRNHPGLKRKTGHIGFLGHGSKLKFRNIRIKEL